MDTTIDPVELKEFLLTCDITRTEMYEDVRSTIMSTRWTIDTGNYRATSGFSNTEHLRRILLSYICTLNEGISVPEYSTEITTWEYCHECNAVLCNCMGYGRF